MFPNLEYVYALDWVTTALKRCRGQILARKLKSSTHKSNKPLSRGGIAAVAIAAVVVILIIILLAMYLQKRRAKNAKRVAVSNGELAIQVEESWTSMVDAQDVLSLGAF